MFAGWLVLAEFLGVLVAGAVVGVLVAGILAPLLIRPIYEIAARLNGSPFVPGDVVEVLAGHYAGRVGRVYSTWQGTSVRVELGELAGAKYQDIFGQHQLRRVRKIPGVPPN